MNFIPQHKDYPTTTMSQLSSETANQPPAELKSGLLIGISINVNQNSTNNDKAIKAISGQISYNKDTSFTTTKVVDNTSNNSTTLQDSSPLDNSRPLPNSFHPLMITDGTEHLNPDISQPTTPQSHTADTSVFVSDQADSDVSEHLLATSAGLLPINATLANDPYAVHFTYQVFDDYFMSLRHNPEVVKLLNALIERGLVDLHGKDGCEGYRPNKHFWDIWNFLFKKNIVGEKVTYTFMDIESCLNNFQAEICVLAVNDKNMLSTEFLLPEQTHIALYTIVADTKIVWAFLTTDQAISNEFLASNQPFGDDLNKKNRPQMLHILLPTRITINDLMPLDFKTVEEAKQYFSQPNIQQKLKEIFVEKFLPQLQKSQTLFNYDGNGVMDNQISAVTEEFDKKQRALAEKRFKSKYVHHLKNELEYPDNNDLKDWLEKIKKKVPQQYPYIIQLANEYNEEHNISTRY